MGSCVDAEKVLDTKSLPLYPAFSVTCGPVPMHVITKIHAMKTKHFTVL